MLDMLNNFVLSKNYDQISDFVCELKRKLFFVSSHHRSDMLQKDICLRSYLVHDSLSLAGDGSREKQSRIKVILLLLFCPCPQLSLSLS
jgi:hypothetical protein